MASAVVHLKPLVKLLAKAMQRVRPARRVIARRASAAMGRVLMALVRKVRGQMVSDLRKSRLTESALMGAGAPSPPRRLCAKPALILTARLPFWQRLR